jgi:oxygen-dependent protoporphyrinogen oxidase
MPPRVVIVGAGMAGLAAAWECHRLGLRPVVLEAAGRAGGVVGTIRQDGYVLDGGADAFLYTKPGARTLCDELDLNGELVEMLPPRGAAILFRGRFHPLPEGGAFGVPVRARAFLRSRLLSWRGKLRVAAEPLLPRRRLDEDEPAGAFFRRRFGAELAERIAQPLMGGIHAGSIDELSAHAVIPQLAAAERRGESVWLALRRQAVTPPPGGVFRSFRSGMGRLPEAVVEALPAGTVQTGIAVRRISRQPDGTFVLETADGRRMDADVVLLAVPAWRASGLLHELTSEGAALCDGVPYVSSATALLAYPEAAFGARFEGSGYLVADRRDADPVMAVTWVTGKWPGRAPAGTTLIRTFSGGAGHEDVLNGNDTALVDAGHAHLARWWRVRQPPIVARVFRWHRASPQHVVGHQARVRTLQARLDALGALGVAGSGFRAVGIPDVVEDARAEMRRLVARWQAR